MEGRGEKTSPVAREVAQSPSAMHRPMQSILRVDTYQSRVHRVTSPRLLASQVEPSSPQPSVDRLSVTFAIAERSCSSDGQEATSPPPGLPLASPTSPNFDFNGQPRKRIDTIDSGSTGKPDGHRLATPESEEAADADYSVSASAIIQRRNSLRRPSRRRRRPSSPFSPDYEGALARRRRSSVYTTSSGDTAISMMDVEMMQVNQEEQISMNLKIHKDVLSGAKSHPWPLCKKLRLIRQAKSYIRKHEGELQERLAQTRSTKDYVARTKLLFSKKWQYFKREVVNFKTVLVPWESTIKHIESQFGSAVASYFIFLRWLFWFNFAISFLLVAFVAIPELLATMRNTTIPGERKNMLPEELERAAHPRSIWEFEGHVKYSPFFYGWYSDRYKNSTYNQPLTYFVVQIIVYTYSFVAILRKMAENSRMSKLSEKEDECAFSWKLFTSWDFMIGNAETAQNRIGNIVLGFKEALVEESEKQRVARNWKIASIRVLVNVVVFLMLLVSAYVVVEIVDRSENSHEANLNWFAQNQVSIVLGLITYVFPIAFEILGMIESYHPRKQLRFQLFRIMILNLLNMYSLIYALFKKINSSEVELQSLKPKVSSSTTSTCYRKLVQCEPSVLATSALAVMSLVLQPNVSSIPKSPNATTNQSELGLSEAYPTYDSPKTFGLDVNDIYSLLGDDEDSEGPKNYIDWENNVVWSSLSVENDTANATEGMSSSYGPPRAEDGYPHVDYDYEGYWDEDNRTEGSTTEQPVTPGVESSTARTITTNEPPTVRPIHDAQAAPTTAKAVPSTTRLVGEPCTGRVVECYERVCSNETGSSEEDYLVSRAPLDMTTRRKLKNLCWETMFGQELAKVTVVDLVLTFISVLAIDFVRALMVRYFNDFWCWDLEKQFPQYGEFKIAENILHLVNNQGMVWMGIFFSPGLILLNLVKLVILMHLRSWTVVTCNVPHEIVFRASRSNNFYLSLLLTMLFLCVLPVGYAITWVEPSWHCGPFSGYKRIYHLATKSLRDALPTYVLEYKILDYIASPGIVIPLIVLMTLVIYYMVSLTNLLRESNNDLKIQLRKERTEERRKMFKIAEQRLESNDKNKQYGKWGSLVPQLSVVKQGIINRLSAHTTAKENHENQKQRSSDDSEYGENTEGEQESLPHDQLPAPAAPVTDLPKDKSATTSVDRKNTCRAGPSHECSGTIPRIRISGEEEHAGGDEPLNSLASEPTDKD
ncbi:transmembrane channel-like protein 2-A [Copidosoma floridanum]|uniref:transmembrane channel-like protein 2-A n=1 Tax=Copidosoma floridanum TaxID=29053 RepID=UPI000C6F5112|nr:transmembrane channel-like protein 2-A [Copidosoma floridanum]